MAFVDIKAIGRTIFLGGLMVATVAGVAACGGNDADEEVKVDASVTQQQGAQMEQMMQDQVKMLENARQGRTQPQGEAPTTPQ